VLDFTKIEAGALELERAPVAPAAIARDVIQVLQARAAEHENQLELEVEPGTAEWMVGDATRLRQILFNLVGNAIKFTENGHVRCALRREGDSFLFAVSDDGVGMSPETLARICAPFVQADASTTRKYGGTGLGLAITRRLVEAMGGTLSIESALGAGSTFRVAIPFVESVAPKPSERVNVNATPLEVLVVDDNAVNRLVAQRLLERMGHRVVLAFDGKEAMERAHERRFDVILMDCHMPVMDGFDATRALRGEGYVMPIFALTAAVTAEDLLACERAGMTDVVRKPLRVEQLEEALARVEPRRAA
jgi:CheY-like chemotaxis protein/anti-sigma regulatory factor (Ser/Thr protein kinase)